MKYEQAVISMFIGKQYTKQGKFAYVDDKPCFFANMTKRKWFRNFGGYAISERVLDALPRGTKIIFKRQDLNTHYITNKSRFRKKGIFGNWGNHRQWCLPLKNWKPETGMPEEPKNLSVIDLSEWKRGKVSQKKYKSSMARLAKIAKEKLK